MDALTPARPTLLGPSQATRAGLLHEQVSLIHAPDLPTLPSPTTCGRSVSSGHVTHRRIGPRLLPHGSSPNGNSGLRHSLAGSPRITGRIEFLIVRTGPSPPAAPHPVSPRRSCRLITSYVNSERTSTSLIGCALRRTSGGFTPPFGEVDSPLQHQIDLDLPLAALTPILEPVRVLIARMREQPPPGGVALSAN